MTFEVRLDSFARAGLLSLDNSIKKRVLKRLSRMETESPGRHLKHGSRFFVIELGGYRIAYSCSEKLKLVGYIGDHKGYERWYKSL